MPNDFRASDLVQLSLTPRDWSRIYPLWRPAKVRILAYADGPVALDGGSFQGLQHVFSVLKSNTYSYVKFEPQFAHRDGTDPSATISGAKKLTDLDILNNYDEIWFFGFNAGQSLDAAELTALDQFMSAPKSGGILVTGDHANLGQGLAGQIKRAGKMRKYPAPNNVAPGWNTTLVEGSDPNATYDFNDQSDDVPQKIRWRRYDLAGGLVLLNRFRPHPVLCGPDGPIDVFPDHQHEGEALAPLPAAGDTAWPSKAGHQEIPQVIAWGRIKDPAATQYGNEIGVLSAYDGHTVDVGRIVADSTWHHWFDINLIGLPFDATYAGFDATLAGQAALKNINAFFLNVGVWLAPPERQQAMRNAAWWNILWTDRIVELTTSVSKASIYWLGEQAIDALGRVASRCSVSEWTLDLPDFKPKIPKWEWPQLFGKFERVNFPLEAFAAGGILRRLIQDVVLRDQKIIVPRELPDAALNRLIEQGATEGLSELSSQLKRELHSAMELVGSRLDFRGTGTATAAHDKTLTTVES